MILIRAWPLLPLGFLALASGDCLCRDPNPPEVQALISTKIPPHVKTVQRFNNQTGKMQEMEQVMSGDIPGFTISGGSEALGYSLGFNEGFINMTPVFIIDRIDKNHATEIVDAQSLPTRMVEWRLVEGKAEYVDGRYRLSTYCEFKDQPKDISRYVRVIGLVKPEKGKADCAHYSGLIEQAWGIDRENGHIESISTKGLKCHYITIDDCQ